MPGLAVTDDVGVRFGGLEDEAVYPPHGLAFADDVPQPVEIADGSLELAVFFLELKLLELLFADVHHQPFEVAQFAVGVENPLALIPYPFQPPGRERNPVHHLIGLVRDNTVIDVPARLLEIVGMHHALDGIVVVPYHVLGGDAEQIITAFADEFQRIFKAFRYNRVGAVHAAAVGEPRQVIEQSDVTFLHGKAGSGREQFHRLLS